MPKIVLTRRKGYTAESFQGIVESLGLLNELKNAETICIKPNLVGLHRDETHQARSTPLWMIETTVAGIRRCNPTAKLYIVESDSGMRKHARDKFINHRLTALEKRDSNLVLYNLSENPTETFDFQGSHFRKRIELPLLFQNEMFFVSLGKVKTHRYSVLSGALKNQFGCLSDIDKTEYHSDLGHVLADLNAFVRPALSILDACPAMEGNGPLHGQDRDLDLIACSDNPVELDAYFARITGLNRYNPKHIQICREALKDLYPMGPPEVVHEELIGEIRPFTYICRRERMKIHFGMTIQKLGQKIANAGRRIQRDRKGNRNGKNTKTK